MNLTKITHWQQEVIILGAFLFVLIPSIGYAQSTPQAACVGRSSGEACGFTDASGTSGFNFRTGFCNNVGGVLTCDVNATGSNTNSSANPSLPTAANATTCASPCGPNETCIKSAAGPLVCRPTATNCTNCTAPGKVCVRATPTATTGTCVDAAPTPPAGGGSGGNAGSGAGGGSGGGGSLLEGLNTFGGAGSGLNTTGTLIGFVANIIRWILGLLGMVFFIIVVLQGYLYMISSGDASKAAAATGAITNAVIGLIIIMGAFLITNYVTSALVS